MPEALPHMAPTLTSRPPNALLEHCSNFNFTFSSLRRGPSTTPLNSTSCSNPAQSTMSPGYPAVTQPRHLFLTLLRKAATARGGEATPSHIRGKCVIICSAASLIPLNATAFPFFFFVKLLHVIPVPPIRTCCRPSAAVNIAWPHR